MARLTTTNGEAIRLHRELAGLNIVQLASRIHVSRGHLTKVERGQMQGSPALLKRIAEALGVETRELVKVNTPTAA